MKKNYLLFAAISLLLWLIPRGMWGQEEGKITISGYEKQEIGYTIRVRGGSYGENVDVPIYYTLNKGVTYNYGGKIYTGTYQTNIRAKDYSESNLKISVEPIEDITDNETLAGVINYIAQKQHVDINLQIAKVEENECVVTESGNYGFTITIKGNVSLRSTTTGQISASISVVDGSSFSMKDINGNCNLNIQGGTSYFENVRLNYLNNSCKLEMSKGQVTIKNSSFENVKLIGGTMTASGPVMLDSRTKAIITGGTLYFTGGHWESISLPENSEGTVNITDGTIDNSINVNAGTLDISGGYIEQLNVTGQGKVSLRGGKYHTIPKISTGATMESLLAEGYRYYTWDLSFQPDLKLPPFEQIKDQGTNLFNMGIQVKKDDGKSFTSPIFEGAKRADIGPNGKDVTAIRLEEYQSSPYRYEIHSEDGLCWIALMINRYIAISGDETFNGIDYLTKASMANGYSYEIAWNSEILLTADLDMSSYGKWIPITMLQSFNGQGHRIKGLNVECCRAAFLEECGKLSNLIVSGTFKSIDDHYPEGIKYGLAAAGLAIQAYRSGSITNCAVEQSTISCKTDEQRRNPMVGGLIANNGETIQNCYVVADISVHDNRVINKDEVPFYYAYAGGLVGLDEGSIENSYFKGTIDCTSNATIHKNNISAYYENEPIHCYVNNDVQLDVLNANVTAHEQETSDGLWSEWAVYPDLNQNYPTFKNVPETTVTITVDLSDLTFTGPTSIEKGENLTATLLPKEGYTLPDEIIVKMGGKELDKDTDYRYNKENGELYIPNVTGDIDIKAKAKATTLTMPFTLKVEGPGKLEGYYLTYEGEEPNLTEKKVYLEVGTPVYFTNGRTFHIKATPDEDASFDRLTQLFWDNPTEEELENFTVKEEYTDYNAKTPTVLTAYFIKKKLVIEEDKEIGGEEEAKYEEIEISIPPKEDGTPSTVTFNDVTVSNKEDVEKASTTIANNTNILLQLNGNNTLGKLINEGNVELNVIPGKDANLTVTEVINKGTLVDNTGLIQEVKDESNNTLLALGESKGDEVYKGQPATLTASASIPSDANVTFQWQRKDGNEWINESKSTIYPEQTPQVRAANLRATTPTIHPYTDTYQITGLTNEGSYEYRCLITTASSSVSTTLSTYTQVTVSVENEEDPNPNPNPTPDPTPSYTYYNVVLPEVTGATLSPSPGTYLVQEGGSFNFSLVLDADYDLSVPVIKAGDKELTQESNGGYKISNVYSDLTISITGVTLNMPTANASIKSSIRVWSKETTLYLYSETPETAWIITFAGEVLNTVSVNGSVEVTGLPHGSYLICIKNQVFKIVL